MSEIPSDLIRQLAQLSDWNSFFKFVVLHFNWFEIYAIISITITLVAMVVVFFNEKKESFKKYHRAISSLMKVVLVLFIMQVVVIFIASYNLNYTPLNNEQVNLLKSIKNSKFQDLLELHMLDHGSNIQAVSIAVKKFKNNGASE